VLQNSHRGVRQLAARRVPPVEAQVHGPEELLKLPGRLGVATHHARLPNLRSIVNPDASAKTAFTPKTGGARLVLPPVRLPG